MVVLKKDNFKVNSVKKDGDVFSISITEYNTLNEKEDFETP
jgi:hypothetical protein